MNFFSAIPRGAWVEVNLNAVRHNTREVKRIVPDNVQIMAVLKGNAYGCGYVQMAFTVLANGADRLATATLGEAVYLRSAGICAPILVLGWIPPEHGEIAINYNITETVYTYEAAHALSARAQSIGKKAIVHVKVDSGMGRLGFLPNDESIDEICRIMDLPGLYVEGIFTHFATAENQDKSYANEQFDLFCDFLKTLESKGCRIPIRHAANSPAVLDLPHVYLDMVRGASLFSGIYSSPYVTRDNAKLICALSLKSRLSNVRKVPSGTKVGYDCTYITEGERIIGCLPIGYGDGYSRQLSNKGWVLLKGKRVPIVGNICMDQTMLDITDVPNAQIGDEVVLIGCQGNEEITIYELAELRETCVHEIVSTLSPRLPRIYLDCNESVMGHS